MAERKCLSCMEYKRGECAGLRACSNYKPAPSVDNSGMEYWPKEMGYRRPLMRKNSDRFRRSDKLDIIRDAENTIESPKQDSIPVDRIRITASCTAESILKEHYDHLVLWLSYEKDYNKYTGMGLLQYKGYYRMVKASTKESDERSALIAGVYKAESYINKHSNIYIITDKDLWIDASIGNRMAQNLLHSIVEDLKRKSCYVTEVVMNGQDNMIRAQIKKPAIIK